MPSPMCAAAAAKSLQSCPTLCDPTDSSPPGSLVPGILQARTLEWVAIWHDNKMQRGNLDRIQDQEKGIKGIIGNIWMKFIDQLVVLCQC